MPDTQRFATLGRPRRVWAVGAVHGEVDRLAALHDHVGARFRPGDRLVYLGNYLGRGERVRDTVDELLGFRRALLAVRGMLASDVVYLRGTQEEMWHKLLQLQFAPNPGEVLRWMIRQGVDATLRAYGGSPEQGLAAARDGATMLSRWTGSLRVAIRSAPGHENLMSALRRAAYTAAADGEMGGLLLVHSGLDPSRPLGTQGDSFWWGGAGFGRIASPYGAFRRVVRGYDPAHGGVAIGPYTASLDGNCGFGGTLVAASLTPEGDIEELIEA